MPLPSVIEVRLLFASGMGDGEPAGAHLREAVDLIVGVGMRRPLAVPHRGSIPGRVVAIGRGLQESVSGGFMPTPRGNVRKPLLPGEL